MAPHFIVWWHIWKISQIRTQTQVLHDCYIYVQQTGCILTTIWESFPCIIRLNLFSAFSRFFGVSGGFAITMRLCTNKKKLIIHFSHNKTNVKQYSRMTASKLPLKNIFKNNTVFTVLITVYLQIFSVILLNFAITL